MATIYCGNCEAACSDKAESCPKCGHPMRVRSSRTEGGSPEQGGVGRIISKDVEISVLRILGRVIEVLGLIVCGASPFERNVQLLGTGVTIVLVGMVGVALAGIWDALERIARK